MDPVEFLILVGICWIFLLFITENRWIRLKNPEIGLGYALLRTQKFNTALSKVAGISKRLWSYIFDVGLLVCLGILIAALLMFTINILNYVQIFLINNNILPKPVASLPNPVPLVPAIPGISISFKSLPYFFVAIMIAAALHELAHGVASIAENIRVKNTGLLFFFVFFGAFVEPDESEIMNAPARKQMRIYAAGAFVNLIIVILLLPLLITPVFTASISGFYNPQPSGAIIVDVCPSNALVRCPASEVNMSPGWVITQAEFSNGTIVNINNYIDFSYFSLSTFAGENVSLKVMGHSSPINLTTSGVLGNNTIKDRGYIGVQAWDYFAPRFSIFDPLWPYYFYNTVFYTMNLSLVLALVNLLPFPPLDGDKFISAFVKSKFSEPNAKKAIRWIRISTFIIFIGNILLSIFISGITPI
ncbi:MAG: site-2 protease family protein [Candidatus Thorarchaeota archaeon]